MELHRRPLCGRRWTAHLYAQGAGLGPWGDPFQYGNLQTVDLSLRGGSERIPLLQGGGYTTRWGSFPTTGNRTSLLPLQHRLHDLGQAQCPDQLCLCGPELPGGPGHDPTDHFGNLVCGGAAHLNTKWRGWLDAPPEGSEEVDARSGVGRTTGSLQLNFTRGYGGRTGHRGGWTWGRPRRRCSTPGTLTGAAHWWAGLSLGLPGPSPTSNTVFTLDYGSSASFDLPREIRSTTSDGFAGLPGAAADHQRVRSAVRGRRYSPRCHRGPSHGPREESRRTPPVGGVPSTAVRLAERVFLTGAVRADDTAPSGRLRRHHLSNSAAPGVMHEESFFDVPWVSQLRLRGAWGAAGQQPSTFAAARLYSPVTGTGDQPGAGGTGRDRELGAGRPRAERGAGVKVGFDLGLLDDRLQIVYTRY